MAAVPALGPLSPAHAGIDPIKRSGNARMKLSLAAYSFRDALGGFKEVDDARRFRGPRLHLRSRRGRAHVVLLSRPGDSRVLPRVAPARVPEGAGDIRHGGAQYLHAIAPGPQLDKEIEHVKRWVDLAAELHAPTIRIFAGDLQKGTSEQDARRWCIDAIHRACEHAASRGIVLALENHGGIVSTPDQLLAIVREIKSDWFGVNLDTGNFHGADPYAELAQLAPYAVVVQVKVEMSPGGTKQRADLGRIVKLLRDVRYQGYVVLEHEAAEDPRTTVPQYLQQLRKLIG